MNLPTALQPAARKLLLAALAFVATATSYLAWKLAPDLAPAPTPPAEVQGVASGAAPEPPPRATGWLPDAAAVGRVRSSLSAPDFAGTEAYRAPYSGPQDVFLWEACRQATGGLLPPRDQGQVGACVGFGTSSAIEHLMCVQVAAGAAQEYRDLAQEVVYGGSRVEVGGGRVSGDGSVGAWAAEFVRRYGVVPRGVHGAADLTRYTEARCREFGARGLTADLEALARLYPVRGVANVRTWSEAKAAIRNGYPVAVCSRQGFTMRRDAAGFCAPSGTWNHCMALVGVTESPRPGGFLLNSWGASAHTGPVGVGNPSPAGFWADAAVLDRMLADGDSWAFSGFAGFPARRLDWYARVPTPPDLKGATR